MVQKPINVNQDLLGYRLKERIGAGGYGEVWSAEAPGGIMKAVKIVFGYHDERRAQNELKSLDRVKSLRHPFLLNLERIDVVDGQLVIITELADKSMADEFNDFVLKGEPGIPRQYLLNQLLEAADALDYISDKHSLQHLDVKPENLLLVGRHIKVADFGLVKDLQDVSQSLMGGLTPAYAAPELFDGRPSTTSDQYSLAIVFQEMLTGQRPFPGTTPAALAAQHMNGKPNLRPLPKSDQLVIAKALSKDSNVRFPNCVSMIQELINRHAVNNKSPKRKIAPTRSVQDTESKEIKVRSNLQPTDATQLLDKSVFQDVPAKFIDSPDCSQLSSVLRPTLFIGIGNSGNQVMRKLRQRMIERFGDLENMPSVKMLCIDTDRMELAELSRFNDGYDLSASETLALPLRKPEDYRSRQKSILNWLSRRWIYNVPRTLKTEGIRPLGRLALIDNFESIYEKLQQIVEQLGKPELLAKSAENIGMEPGKVEPQVFIVSSISGGSGSGMMNDMAYVTKLVLSEYGQPRDCINGVMMHSTSQSAGDPGLAATNSFAFLTELRHFTQFGYPGDDTQGLPDLPDEAPFESSYFLDLGNDVSPHKLSQKFNNIAEYLFLNTVSKSNKFFNKCRELESEIDHFALRSIGVATCGVSNTGCYQELVEQLCGQMLRKWTQGGAESSELANSIFEPYDKTQINAENIEGKLQEHTDELAGHDDIIALNQALLQKYGTSNRVTRNELIEETEAVFGSRDGNTLGTQTRICQRLTTFVNQFADETGRDICVLICRLLNSERLDLNACLRAAGCFQEYLSQQRDKTRTVAESLYIKIEKLEEELILWHDQQGKGQPEKPLATIVETYLKTSMQEVRIRYTSIFMQKLNAKIDNLNELFRQYIGQLNTTVGSRFTSESSFNNANEIELAFAKQLQEKLPQLVGAVELQLFHQLIDEHGGYTNALDDHNCLNYLIPETLTQVAQTELAGAARRLNIESIVANLDVEPHVVTEWSQSMFDDADVYLDDCGGDVRSALVIPADSDGDMIGERFTKPDAPRQEVTPGTFGDLVLVSEAEDVPVANVAFRLLQFRPDCIELTKRLHTRSDIDWISLEDLM